MILPNTQTEDNLRNAVSCVLNTVTKDLSFREIERYCQQVAEMFDNDWTEGTCERVAKSLDTDERIRFGVMHLMLHADTPVVYVLYGAYSELAAFEFRSKEHAYASWICKALWSHSASLQAARKSAVQAMKEIRDTSVQVAYMDVHDYTKGVRTEEEAK